ncbi:MAG: hypothetical protein LBN33_09935, partial [Desulfovibrio sp.]|nr:hypothetical protein [Desulfovibrio sp.]
MAADSLSLAESLRPWRTAGVISFLSPVQEDALFLQPEGAETATSPHPRSFTSDAAISSLAAGEDSPPLNSERQNDLDPQAVFTPALGTVQKVETPATLPPPLPMASLSEAELISAWHESWKKIYSRTPKAPLIWTYVELGLDLSGQGDPRRSQFLKELIARLDLPRGSSAFWPLCLP